MMLSKTCDYAIRAAFYLAAQQERKFVPIKEISEELGISFHFLTKILQILTQNNLMISFKGPNGGIALTRKPESIALIEIITAVDGLHIFNECIIGLQKCGEENPCPLHHEWAGIRDQIKDLFENTSLAQASEKVKNGEFRLSDLVGQNGIAANSLEVLKNGK